MSFLCDTAQAAANLQRVAAVASAARLLDRHDHFADRPECQAQREEKMAECQPPARENEPDDIAERAERTGTEIVATGIGGARYGGLAERQQGVDGDVEGGGRPPQG